MSEQKKTRMQGIVDEDKERPELADWRKIHLFCENGFLRAYNRSCWLQHLCFPDLKVQHRVLAGCAEALTYIGFPDRSMGHFCIEGSDVVTNEDGSLCLVLPESYSLPYEDVKSLEEAFCQWKGSIPVTESVKEKRKSSSCKSSTSTEVVAEDSVEDPFNISRKVGKSRIERASFSGIAQEVLSFPIESHSPIECMLFLQKIKEKYASLY